ncbi:MAG: gliding motility-associated ABC transporter permease subunit GldF [Bacteroidales bacterium]|nr:gliding motility-associated ABC transporter permease subunit GldF [Bacteroidales bacterium]MCF8333412.1 gliding motility-associated ABC transporter permease subunit GldF [Bacteroidales bacterium]
MLALLKKEISSFLSSLIGYITIIVFLLINGLFLFVFPTNFNILDYGYSNIDGLFMIGPFVFLFLIPAITMRLFADEKNRGTIEFLLTNPLSDLEIVMAKYLAGFILVIFALVPTLIYYGTVYYMGMPVGNIDEGGMWGSYIGLLLLGSAFVSTGMFTSSITDNQIVSFISAVVLTGFLYIGFELIYELDMFGPIDLFIKELGMSTHYAALSRGVIDTRDVLYFLSVDALFILLTKFSLETRKWE